jgi:topoisomerase IA-like protein
VLKELGKHNNKKVNLQSGRYGVYIKYGTKNIALPKELKDETKAQELTLEEAIKLIDDK